MEVIQKATARAAGANPLEYVMSDATIDRYGDVIEPDGWNLKNFRNNPVALFGHDSRFPIGFWKNVRVADGALRGELELLPEGRSERVDEIRAFVESGILRAVSVGFQPLSSEPLDGSKSGGRRYTKAELVECSLVSVPANPNALQIAKELNLSSTARQLIFGKSADEDRTTALRTTGEHAATSPYTGTRTMNLTLTQRIENAQADLVRDKDALTAHLAEDNADPIVTDELSARVEQKEAGLAALKRAETALATKTTTVSAKDEAEQQRRPFAAPAKKIDPKDYVYRAGVVSLISKIQARPKADVLRDIYGEDELTRVVFDVVTKAATAPATTTTTGWAAELVQTAIGDFIESLMPNSIYPSLSTKGGRFSFGRNGIVSLPSRAATPAVAGSFVGQGSPIPVRQAAFAATTLTPKKMAVITTFTREIAEHSIPSIEQILRQAIQEDTAVAIDTVLLDATAASTIRPAGLRNGVTVTTATSGGGFAALVGDLKALIGALISGSNGQLRSPVWLMNPIQVLAASVTQNAGGDFPFKEEIANGTLLGYPIIASSTVTAGMVFLVDAADFFSATGDDPRFDLSDQATLHMEDTTPLAIGTAGSPNTVAAPVRSLFQTDSIALRMILDMNWALRRTGTVAWTQSVTW